MSFQGLREDHCLEGASNLRWWKEWIPVVLEDNGVIEFVKNQIVPPQDAQQLIRDNNSDTKAERIIHEGAKDHIIPHLQGKNTTY